MGEKTVNYEMYGSNSIKSARKAKGKLHKEHQKLVSELCMGMNCRNKTDGTWQA